MKVDNWSCQDYEEFLRHLFPAPGQNDPLELYGGCKFYFTKEICFPWSLKVNLDGKTMRPGSYCLEEDHIWCLQSWSVKSWHAINISSWSELGGVGNTSGNVWVWLGIYGNMMMQLIGFLARKSMSSISSSGRRPSKRPTSASAKHWIT